MHSIFLEQLSHSGFFVSQYLIQRTLEVRCLLRGRVDSDISICAVLR